MSDGAHVNPETHGAHRTHETDETDEARALRVARELGALPTTVHRLSGGAMNSVLRVVGDGVDWVVRSPLDLTRPDVFPLERWASQAAAACGVPVPEVLHVGTSGGVPVTVSRYVEPAHEDPLRPWWWLGRHAAALAGARLDDAPDALFSRFGRDLDRAWREHLDYNLACLSPDDHLLADGGYSAQDLETLRAWVRTLQGLDVQHGLVHGDLAPRNLVSRGLHAAPVLLDWGSATSGPAPWDSLQRVYQAAVVEGEIPWSAVVDVAEGMGTVLDDATAQTLRRLTALRLLDLARWARDQRPDLYASYRDACSTGLATLWSLGPR